MLKLFFRNLQALLIKHISDQFDLIVDLIASEVERRRDLRRSMAVLEKFAYLLLEWSKYSDGVVDHDPDFFIRLNAPRVSIVLREFLREIITLPLECGHTPMQVDELAPHYFS